jgi:hypothetical protein
MPATWDITTVRSYIDNQVEENINLDYKAADALQKTDGKKKDVSKDVSALANAGGGAIIYGIKEFDETAKRHLPKKIDPINRAEISKEWLEQVINTNIQPKIEGIIITPVTIDDAKGTVVYVVEVPQSTTAHQANDKKYYKRYNFESVPMEDYEIRDIMSRLKHPDVTLEFVLEQREEVERDPIHGTPKTFSSSFPFQKIEPKKWFEYRLKVAIRNTGKVYANFVNYFLELPEDIVYKDEDLKDSDSRSDYKVFYGENTMRDITGVKLQLPSKTIYDYGPSRFDPVLPGRRSKYETIRLINNLHHWEKELFWTIYADNAEVKRGNISLSVLATNMKYNRD